jgi:hypothetical protein
VLSVRHEKGGLRRYDPAEKVSQSAVVGRVARIREIHPTNGTGGKINGLGIKLSDRDSSVIDRFEYSIDSIQLQSTVDDGQG